MWMGNCVRVVLFMMAVWLEPASSSEPETDTDLSTNETCAEAYEYFRQNLNLPQHLSSALPHDRPIIVEKSMVCNQAASSCCTPEMETYFQKDILEDFRTTLVNKKNKWIELAREQHDSTKKHYVGIITHAGTLMDIMFEKTYGEFYCKRKGFFTKFFKDLETSFINSSSDVSEIFDKFYHDMVREVFQLLNPHYIYTDEFLECLASKPEHIMITGQPLRLATMVERSFEAPHKLLKTLEESRILLEKLFEEDPVKVECASKLSQLKFCARCQNNLEVLPCLSTCVDVVRDCLNQSLEIRPEFLKQFDGKEMDDLFQDLQGPYNMYTVIKLQLSEPISQAIMQLQGLSSELRQTVLRDCPEPAINASIKIPIILKSNTTTKDYMSEEFIYNSEEGYGLVTNESQYSYVTDDVDLEQDSLERTARSVREKRNKKKNSKKSGKMRRRRRQRKNRRRNQRRNRDDENDDLQQEMTDREQDVRNLITGLGQVIEQIQREWKDLENVMCYRMSASDRDSQCWSGTGLITVDVTPDSEDFDMHRDSPADDILSPGDMTSSGSGESEQSDDEDDGFGSGDFNPSRDFEERDGKISEGGKCPTCGASAVISFQVWTLLITWASFYALHVAVFD